MSGPNETLNIACIGVGGKGRSDTEHAANHGRLVALCDVDEKRLDAMGDKHKDAKKYVDYRELLARARLADRRRGRLDARPHACAGRRDGHAAGQARLLPEAADPHGLGSPADAGDSPGQKKVCTQMGNQGTADPGFRRGAELVRAGVIGDVAEVHVWTNRPFKYWKQAPDIVARPKETPPVPSHLHWDLFLGTAPERPYNPVYHPHDWRGWWDFGTGSLGDMACHTANLTFMGLELGLPTRVSAHSGEINSETYPAWATITYEFPARGNQPPSSSPGTKAPRTASATCRRPRSSPTASSRPTAARS